jgi:hypothetical protein
MTLWQASLQTDNNLATGYAKHGHIENQPGEIICAILYSPDVFSLYLPWQ